ncbi:SCO family protein [Subsaximicrobium wynnwilliamsii]|uniref:SCO family protein n=1 Tax=Subsaximicrobium wynnwilliamsii TaxID=291179 RepID=A0A5C6ZFS1_9FLAO|nr:SCO family protein [Subsaximicrobium wynnwilliamsii]TXD82453.1 SCO family protein [Subsaximicrobium wynnwilliamsii]TXD88095.1 SCO family protein [Subsaximicrobium wynnwilliamsii]TXE02043.1 SCO family protein [Subsaximicrobium wynnwilliamsii]
MSSKKTNYSYIGIAFVLLVFGIIFIPKIVDRIKNGDISRDESRSSAISVNAKDELSDLMFLEINGSPKKVPPFEFVNQDGDTITNKDYEGMVYLVEFFFTTCPSICPKMNRNLVQIQNTFTGFENFGIAAFTINPEYDTPEVLKAYAKNYGITNPNWNLMTGNKEEIYALANIGFNIYAAENPEVEGGFEHSGSFALIDKNGFMRSRQDDFGNPKIFYKGIISEEEQQDEDGETEEISMLKEDIAKLLKE